MAEPEAQEQKEPVLRETKEHPYEGQHLTREDVLRLIQENGGTAQGLDLAGAVLIEANLQGLHLAGVNLQRALLEGANLQGALLQGANLNEGKLERADLRGAYLANIRLFYADLSNIEWGDYVLGEEREGNYEEAMQTYRSLKAYHTQAGMGDVAGRFYYREMECQRKALSWLKEPFRKFGRTFLWLFGGYGERPLWILGWWVLLIILASLIMVTFGGAPISSRDLPLASATPSSPQNSLIGFGYAVYYVLVSFTALGYGGWVAEPTNPWKFFGAGVSLLGAIFIGIFVVFLARVLLRQ